MLMRCKSDKNVNTFTLGTLLNNSTINNYKTVSSINNYNV